MEKRIRIVNKGIVDYIMEGEAEIVLKKLEGETPGQKFSRLLKEAKDK